MNPTAPTPAHSLTPARLAERLYRQHEESQRIAQSAITHGYVSDPEELLLLLDAGDSILRALGDEVLRADPTKAAQDADMASMESRIAVLLFRHPREVKAALLLEETKLVLL